MTGKITAKEANGIIRVKILLSHGVESGIQQRSDGSLVQADYITDISISLNGRQVMVADIGPSISKDPYFSFYLTGKKGDEVSLVWRDNHKYTETIAAVAK